MLLVVVLPAVASGYAIDAELVRSEFSGAAPGLSSPTVGERGSWRAGLLAQFEKNPLVLASGGDEMGAVVANRLGFQLGASVSLSDRVAAHGTLPLGASFGSEVPGLAADGFGLGDLSAGLGIELVDGATFDLGLHADLYAPLSAGGSYFGEEGPRFSPGLALAVSPGALRVAADAALMLRGAVATAETLGVGQELVAALDLSVGLFDDRVRPHAEVLSRLGLQSELAGPGTVPVEALAGVELHLGAWSLDLYGGRGLSSGYGATDARALFAISRTHRAVREAEPDEPRSQRFVSDLTDEEFDKLIEAPSPPEPEAADRPLAVISREEIVIRDALQFEEGTDRIVPSSVPTLRAVGLILHDHPDIATLIVEGHASGEGSFAYNYDLSVRRSLAVFRALVEIGVHPSRLAIRGFGEVAPVATGQAEANRRVVFTIARRLGAGEAAGWSREVVLPWSGESRTLAAPAAPVPAAPIEGDDE